MRWMPDLVNRSHHSQSLSSRSWRFWNTTSSLRNENLSTICERWSSCTASKASCADFARAGCVGAYSAIAESDFPKALRKRIGSVTRSPSGKSGGTYVGVLRLLRALEHRLHGRLLGPSVRQSRKRREHLRRFREQLHATQELRPLHGVAEQPLECLGVRRRTDHADPERAHLRLH